MSHTPGPRLVKEFDAAQIVVLGPDQGNGTRELIATFTGQHRRANAVLDAAAPQLLEACRDIRDFLRTHGYDTRILDAAIAAATD